MNLMVCGRCGHSKKEFQTIKFGDIFPNLQAEECHCSEEYLSQGQRLPPPNISLPPSEYSSPLEPSNPGFNPPLSNQHGHGVIMQPQQYLNNNGNGGMVATGGSHSHHEQSTNGLPYNYGDNQNQNLISHHEQQSAFMDYGELGLATTSMTVGNVKFTIPSVLVHPQQHQNQTSQGLTPTAGQDNNGSGNRVITSVTVTPAKTDGNGDNKKHDTSSEATNSPKLPPPPPPAPRVPCHLCKKTFVNDRLKNAHVQRVHEKVNRYVCELCGAAFSYRGSLDSHLCSHNLTPEVTVDCTQCGQKFKEKSNLNQHVKMMHSDNPKRFMCPHCPSGFTKRVNLRYHIKRKHPDQDPSGETTTTSNNNNNNDAEMAEGGGRGDNDTHKCIQCSRTFLFKNNLKAHMKTHSKEKKYACTLCEKSFIYKESLKNHMLLHSNEMPYECEVCGKKFRDRSNRRKHVKNVHKYLFQTPDNNTSTSINTKDKEKDVGNKKDAENNVNQQSSVNGDGNSQSLPVLGKKSKPKSSKKASSSSDNKDSPPVNVNGLPPPPINNTTNVIKKATSKKKSKKAPLLPPPISTSTSVIVSNTATTINTATPIIEMERKIIMSPEPRPPPQEYVTATTNVIVKAAPAPPVPQMHQNVIVYSNKAPKAEAFNSHGSPSSFFTSGNILENTLLQQQQQNSFPNGIQQQYSNASIGINGSSSVGNLQYQPLSRGIITSVQSNNIMTTEPEEFITPDYQSQQDQQQYWNNQQSNQQHIVYMQQQQQPQQEYVHSTGMPVMIYNSDQGSGGTSANNNGLSLEQSVLGGVGGVTENILRGDDVYVPQTNNDNNNPTNNNSVFLYKDLSQFDFSYL